jgi:hypothetical protein
MRKTLLITALFVSEFCIGQIQKWDSAYLMHWMDSTGVVPSGVDLTPLHLPSFFGVSDTAPIPETKDTIPILMLVCDTSIKEYETLPQMGIIKSYLDVDKNVIWEKGYEVRDVKYQYADVSVDPNHQMSDGAWTLLGRVPIYKQMPYYTFLKYLDADKKELSKNIIVWMYNEIKK